MGGGTIEAMADIAHGFYFTKKCKAMVSQKKGSDVELLLTTIHTPTYPVIHRVVQNPNIAMYI